VTRPALAAHPLTVRPLTDARWPDLEELFGPNGAYSNCWCAYQRVTGREFSAGCANRGAGNRALLRSLTMSGNVPGLIGYRQGRPVGWVSVAPRPQYGRIVRSPVTRLDASGAADASVWSVACFYIPARNRGQGIATALLDAAVTHARAAGAAAVEGYPVDTGGRRVPGSNAFTGTLDLFERAGFRRIAERLAGRPVVRLDLRGSVLANRSG
jgi:GNAT superfamily N-acetyltransferase